MAAERDAAPATALHYGAQVLRRHGRRLLLVFVALLLPLWAFGELADEIHEQEAITFDEPILLFAHTMARQGFDDFFVFVSKLGYAWGVVPFDIVLVLALTVMRRYREATFAAIALGGSALLNIGAKLVFARERPSLWESIAPETNYSFPSGHAMGSMTLACTLVFLAWHTRWRWLAIAVMVPFVLLVGLSRVYLGVHYPSDILAGWAVASAWVAAVFLSVYGVRLRPWHRHSGTGARP
ncbi:phosphatase PAP2 family protein [Lysobacter sp. LF1]|uniref:undecaprenyl-diphosphate phosphatase n=1 Tax=Lysobacter stagni TaxID=3045172 RepID=A0ABT6XGY1_9GAMM|nr:phosphatase PAP2 family protein [Lysobacter sp. LF1]MDI9239422.1 phosphatase PAP2 family protein [Lysobacter sp. LF1]